MLGTDARAAALRRLVVSGAPPPQASQVPGALSVGAWAALADERHIQVYRALWRDLGLHRIQVGHPSSCMLVGRRVDLAASV